MVASALYRPFEEDDFDAVASIVREAWYQDAPSADFARLEAGADLADCLSRATFSQVAITNGTVAGVVLVRAGRSSERWRLRWSERKHALLEQMTAQDPGAVQALFARREHEDAINRSLLTQANLPDDYEIVLLAVSAQAQGYGVGTLLLDAAATSLASRGATGAYLYTDTSCTWEFYEKRKLKRLASYRTPRHDRRLLADEYYLYGMDLSD